MNRLFSPDECSKPSDSAFMPFCTPLEQNSIEK